MFEIVFPVSSLFHQYVVSHGSDIFTWEYKCGYSQLLYFIIYEGMIIYEPEIVPGHFTSFLVLFILFYCNSLPHVAHKPSLEKYKIN